MKNIRSLLASAALGLIATSAAFAATSLDRPANLPGPDSIAPIPVKVVQPELPPLYRDISVTLEFTLDKAGKAHDIVAVGKMPKDLADAVLPAVALWEFSPCRDAQGNPVVKKVILPLVLAGRPGSSFAAVGQR